MVIPPDRRVPGKRHLLYTSGLTIRSLPKKMKRGREGPHGYEPQKKSSEPKNYGIKDSTYHRPRTPWWTSFRKSAGRRPGKAERVVAPLLPPPWRSWWWRGGPVSAGARSWRWGGWDGRRGVVVGGGEEWWPYGPYRGSWGKSVSSGWVGQEAEGVERGSVGRNRLKTNGAGGGLRE